MCTQPHHDYCLRETLQKCACYIPQEVCGIWGSDRRSLWVIQEQNNIFFFKLSKVRTMAKLLSPHKSKKNATKFSSL